MAVRKIRSQPPDSHLFPSDEVESVIFFVPLLPPSGPSGHSTHIPLLTFANLTRQPLLRLFSLYKEKLRRHRGLLNSTRQADIWLVLLFRWPPLNAPPADTVNHKRSVIANQSPDFPLFFCSPPAKTPQPALSSASHHPHPRTPFLMNQKHRSRCMERQALGPYRRLFSPLCVSHHTGPGSSD